MINKEVLALLVALVVLGSRVVAMVANEKAVNANNGKGKKEVENKAACLGVL